jgi:hypothetical protein
MTDFHHGMPRATERIFICAHTYQMASDIHRDMRKRGACQAVFMYVGVAEQVRKLNGSGAEPARLFLAPSWSRLIDAPIIEMEAKRRSIQLVNYEF